MPERARPHKIKYDDPDRGKEWLNLNVHPFLDIEVPSSVAKNADAPVSASTLKKRKPEFLVDPPQPFPQAAKKARIKQEEEEAEAKIKCLETCGICMSRAKRARAASCHHIFCKRCIENEETEKCPICNLPMRSPLVTFDAEHESFKAVEALRTTTAEVIRSYSSASAASLESKDFTPSLIIEACKSKRRDDRQYKGYYWRFEGCKGRILRVGEATKDGIPIEQLDPKTLKVVQVFPSSRKASEKTKVTRCAIKRVLERRRKALAGGFFWRFQGETHGPWPDPEPTNLNPVEQLDFETGDFLRSFDSLADAKRAMGVRMNAGCIRDVCGGRGRATAYGFFWRWKGSNAVPNHMMGVEKILQIRKKRRGRVVKEFRTSREAQAYFGHSCCWSAICRYCREQGFYLGYYWQYRLLREKKSDDEAVIGKRLRVHKQRGSHEYLEGVINSFDTSSGIHEIRYDCGAIEHLKLTETEYEWKNDQGQKPVEKLDLETGIVLETFDSITQAAHSIGPSARPINIISVCQGRYRSSCGFFWRYKGSDAQPVKRKNVRKVQQLCLKTGRVLATFDTIAAAARAVGIATPGISYCCNGRNWSKSAGGFGWRFSTTDEA